MIKANAKKLLFVFFGATTQQLSVNSFDTEPYCKA
ncbi:MAG: hypothetical protein ACI8O8_002941, partial [Oleiphilaceae bacterium]